MSKPGISDDLNFYKSALQNKLKLAKIYADTIEECKRKITFIRNKLDNKNKTEEEKQNLIKDLEEQQRLYKKGLVEMKQIQNETNHLEAGLKQAEIRVVHKFQNWLEDKNLPNQIYSYLEEKTSPHNPVLKPAEKPNYGIVPTVVTKEKEHQNYALTSKPVVVRLYDRKMQPVKISKVSIQSNDNLRQNSESFTNVSTDKSKNIDDLDYFESISSIKNVTKPNTIQEIISQRVEKASCKSDGDSSRESIQPSKLSDTNKISLENNIEKNYVSNKSDLSSLFIAKNNVTSTSEVTKETISKTLTNYIDPPKETAVNDTTEDHNDFADYFNNSDTLEFKDFMKTVKLSGVSEIDEEIVNFYRSKFC